MQEIVQATGSTEISSIWSMETKLSNKMKYTDRCLGQYHIQALYSKLQC